ncbi:helix-turn-helix domain-containing protein [Sporosarcina beigongshangi]|uniref:helix-turn-helix domain-containing protein n=1 Tax=Sporosarcina beigongshangi TaxID=2782538 RepID=UPI0019398800|nr:RodZ domain-containing protein [Sporosarcina beigongshangi]
MTGLGDRLREARIAKGFTLDDLQSITKIQKRYLSGIENEEYSMMPGAFYVRAFIKQYAEAVGLNADEMLALYKDSSPSTILEEEKPQISSPTMTRKRGLKSSNRLNEAMPKVIVALFIIVIFVAFWFLYQQGADKNKQNFNVEQEEPPVTVEKKPTSTKPDPDNAADDDEVDPIDEEPDPEIEKPQQSLVYESTNGETSTYALTGAETFILEIKTSGDSWIGVLDSAKKERMVPKADIMRAGGTVEMDVSDTESVRIRVGRTQSTEIFVNGELLKYETDLVTQNIIIEYKKEL